MELRRTKESYINDVIKIIKQAQAYFKEHCIDQWQNNYPNSERIKSDIDKGYGYVLLKDEKIIATAAVSFDGEKTYNDIYDGKWITNNRYVVIHRIAVDNSYKGLGVSSLFFKEIENLCLERNISSIRIDTHNDNLSMRRLLEKNDFQYCGIIHLQDNSKRIAFEKII